MKNICEWTFWEKLKIVCSLLSSFCLWLLANAVLPIVLPAIFVWGMEMLLDGTSDFLCTLKSLWKEGFYIFSSLALTCSLLEDYDAFQKTIKWYEAVFLTVFMFAIGIMFYCMERYKPGYFQDNFSTFVVMWIGLALLSGEIKLRMIISKQH